MTGQTFGTAMPHGMPASHTGVSGFECQLHVQFQFPTDFHLEKHQVVVQVLGSLSPARRSPFEFWTLEFQPALSTAIVAV